MFGNYTRIHILVYIIVPSILKLYLFSFVVLVLSCYVCYCVNTLRTMKKNSEIPCICTHPWPIKLILILKLTQLKVNAVSNIF